MNLKWIAEHFDKSQIVVLFFALIFGFWRLRNTQKETQFRVREADRSDLNQNKGTSRLAEAKLGSSQKKTFSATAFFAWLAT